MQAAESHIKDLSPKDLKRFVQQRGWGAASGGDVELSGRGRTHAVIQAQVLAKLRAEAAEKLEADHHAPWPTVVASDGSSNFATSEDLEPWHCTGWEVAADASEDVCARLGTTLLGRLSARSSAAGRRLPSRRTRWANFDLELRPDVCYRARLVGGEPCVAILVSHAVKLPPELNLAELCGGVPERIDGLEVISQPHRMGGRVVGFAGRLGDIRHELLALDLSKAAREAIVAAPAHEPCWRVKVQRTSSVLTFLGSKLQPRLTSGNVEMLDRARGIPSGSQVGQDSILQPKERRHLIDLELQNIADTAPAVAGKLFPSSPLRLSSDAQGALSSCFTTFRAPGCWVGNRKATSNSGKDIWASLERHGLYRLSSGLGQDVKVCGFLLGEAKGNKNEFAKAEAAFSGVCDLLTKVGLRVARGPPVATRSVDSAIEAAAQQGAQAVLFFGGRGSSGLYHQAKSACMVSKAPRLAHLASQWIDVSKKEASRPALQNIVLQLAAKLGHTPYVLQSDPKAQRNPVLCGVDVCHLWDPRQKQMVHVIAGLQLRLMDGELEDNWVCQGRINGESIPPSVWKAVLTKKACKGREVVVHRDGRFTTTELQFLAEHAKEVQASGPFGLVEIVKFAGGTPRMYAGSANAPSGSFLRLSETEGMLLSGTCWSSGTRNPLLIRVVGPGGPGTAPSLSIDVAAEDIFRLSCVSYGSLYSAPRLPVTTRTADKAAYFHATADVHKTQQGQRAKVQEEQAIFSQGRQQYWL